MKGPVTSLALGLVLLAAAVQGLIPGLPSGERLFPPGFSADSILLTGTRLYSQRREELIIRDFFGDRTGGVFLDVGCSHWEQSSTTLYLEKHLGWTGVGVDALDNVRRGYERFRPGTRFFQYIVSDTSGGLATLHVAGPVSSTDPEWKNRFQPLRDTELKRVQVPRITLDDLLDQAGITRLDFLSMDIEGGEREALRGFDLARYHPELTCIEVAKHNRAWVDRHFAGHGYRRLLRYAPYDRVNRYYARVDPAGRAHSPKR